MLLDKETVKNILDKEDKEYENNLVILSMLPDDTVFDLIIEDSVYVEYFDVVNNKPDYFNVKYDYFNTSSFSASYIEGSLNKDLSSSLISEEELVRNKNKRLKMYVVVVPYILTFMVILLFIYFIYESSR